MSRPFVAVHNANESENMIVHSERELKFAADQDTLKAVLKVPLQGQMMRSPLAQHLKTTYFDTDALDLMREGLSLRLRQAGGSCTLGVKKDVHAHAGYFERDEEEAPLPSTELNLDVLGRKTSSRLRETVGEKMLEPRFGSDVRRTLKTLRFHGADIEVALDEGFLFAGKRREPTNEIEFELKAGAPAALFEFGLTVADALPLTPAILSKAERAARLLSREPFEPVRATLPNLAPDTSAEEAIGMLLRNCLNHFLVNIPVVHRGGSMEATHQMHIAMRKLSSVLALVYRRSPTVELRALRVESKRIANLLGQARDWDVFVESICKGPLRRFCDTSGLDNLIDAAQSKAQGTRGAVRQLTSDGTLARFTLRLNLFVERWGYAPGGGRPDWAFEPVVDFASKSLDRLHRGLLRRGVGFRSQAPRERHALRVAVKRMRYAAEFFGNLFHPHSAAERYIDKAKTLQDLLGQQNDMAIAIKLIKGLDCGQDAELASAAGIAAKWFANRSGRDKLVAREAWQSLHKAKPFWRDKD
jgi:triphosphatase